MTILKFIRREKVFCIAFLLALLSCFFITPDAKYVSYIDSRVLLVLFSLMLVVSGLRSCGIFDACADFLCKCVKTQRTLAAVLVFLCFSFSMFITNDVALLTFVPFAILLVTKSGGKNHITYIVVLQTIAANLGSMLMPTGNPQNIFLYSKMECNALEFISIVFPYSALSILLLCISLLAIPRTPLQTQSKDKSQTAWSTGMRSAKLQTAIFIILFIISLLCVLKIIPALLTALICLIVTFIVNKKLLAKVDYVLLLTFCAFFVFTGNIERIPAINLFLQNVVNGNEFLSGVIASQIISNVPASLLLYPFSTDTKDLLIGVNAGGLGTLVASLASLISYKLYNNWTETQDEKPKTSFMLIFTLMNVAFLIALGTLYFVLK